MNHLGYYERALGMGDEPSYESRFSGTVVMGALGGIVAMKIAPKKDRNVALVGGALSAIAMGAIGQAILPLSGALYWFRVLMFPAGGGAIVGVHLKKQAEREIGYVAEIREARRSDVSRTMPATLPQ